MCSGAHENGVLPAGRLPECCQQDRIPVISLTGDAMQALFIASLFLSVTLTTFMLVVSLTNLAGPVLGLTIH